MISALENEDEVNIGTWDGVHWSGLGFSSELGILVRCRNWAEIVADSDSPRDARSGEKSLVQCGRNLGEIGDFDYEIGRIRGVDTMFRRGVIL